MTPQELKLILKSTRAKCYLRFKNNSVEVIEEISEDAVSRSIQGKIIGADNTSRVGLEVNVGLETLHLLPRVSNTTG